jgi:hypothetical protein
MEREKIITLLVEDLKHNQLLNGLESIGLTDNGRYLLSLDRYIAQLMGFETLPDEWQDVYQQSMLSVCCSLSEDELQSKAQELYQRLVAVQNE